jgi:hypothetical protein
VVPLPKPSEAEPHDRTSPEPALLRDKDHATLALWLLMALWFVPFSILSRGEPPCRKAETQ